jgi:hypothetical protein
MTSYILTLTSAGIGLREAIACASARFPAYLLFSLWQEE